MPDLSRERAVQFTAQLTAAFGDREFTGTEAAPALGLKSYHGTGMIFSALLYRRMLQKTANGYRVASDNGTVSAPEAPQPIARDSVAQLTAELVTTSRLIKAGGYYIAGEAILIAGTHERDKVVLYTSIIESETDPVTKAKLTRNKRIVFTRQQEPDEYAAIMAWLRANASEPQTSPEDAHAALQLAEEATSKLTTALAEIETLKGKLAQFRAMLQD